MPALTKEIIHAGYYMNLARLIIFKIHAPELLRDLDTSNDVSGNYANGTMSSAAHFLEHAIDDANKAIPDILADGDNMLMMKFGKPMAALNNALAALRDGNPRQMATDRAVAIAWEIAEGHDGLRRIIKQAGYPPIDPDVHWAPLGVGGR